MPDWLTEFPSEVFVDIRTPIDNAIDYMTRNWGGFFAGIANIIRAMLNAVGAVVNLIPWWLLILLIGVATYAVSRKILRSFVYAALIFFIGMIGLWNLLYLTLTLVITSVIISLLIGLPTGVLISASRRIDAIVRPILDTMQTMPSFVYLIPAVMLLGLGSVPAVIATTIYAVPPVIRLTAHGIKQVDTEVVEAAMAFGSTKMQTLIKVQIPQALPTIMTGVNQTIMLAISMVVTSSMIAAPGLGSEVITGINRLESGRGFAAGIAIVIVAIVMDRLTQGIVKKKED